MFSNESGNIRLGVGMAVAMGGKIVNKRYFSVPSNEHLLSYYKYDFF